MASETLEHLPRSERVLVHFVQYWAIKRECPHLSVDDQGTPKSHHSNSNVECKFENCPKIGKGVIHE